MIKSSTQENCEVKQEVKIIKHPKLTTVNFIKQFARVYKYNELVPAGMGSLVIN